ncbi:hypothetical protein PanWU01x14_117690 [Parasponia andersonii]|uniref:Uncharacterized protein n=1 Tax=Parasponia andersonii TaxID=3476 RepID=A0A2P5CW21_PARAD|nr:hypothetical protein PanWU01x14_117690 [Parasponia andersonii]
MDLFLLRLQISSSATTEWESKPVVVVLALALAEVKAYYYSFVRGRHLSTSTLFANVRARWTLNPARLLPRLTCAPLTKPHSGEFRQVLGAPVRFPESMEAEGWDDVGFAFHARKKRVGG